MKKTKEMIVGNVKIGGGNPISVQSMSNVPTKDAEASIRQIEALANAGADIVRLSVPDMESAEALKSITSKVSVPIVADIHFDYRLAIAAALNGAAKIRINPGNIGGKDKVKMLADVLKERKIPIRIGVNGGSLEKEMKNKYGVSAKSLTQSALSHAAILEDVGFDDICLSVKCSDVRTSVEAYRMLNDACDYPLHVGITEAGVLERAVIKSAIGIGSLLLDGIGDTIRVSISGDPIEEVKIGRKILNALKLDTSFVEIISCPTCARTVIEVEQIAKLLEEKTQNIKKHVTIAVMGCVVNGPGEAEEADFGVAGGDKRSAIFSKGKLLKTCENADIVQELLQLLEQYNG